jgi:hypothetical protein
MPSLAIVLALLNKIIASQGRTSGKTWSSQDICLMNPDRSHRQRTIVRTVEFPLYKGKVPPNNR